MPARTGARAVSSCSCHRAYDGDVPEGYFVFRSPTFGNLIFWRGFLVNGDTKPAVANFKENTRIYPLAKAGNPPEQQFVNISGRDFNTIHANNFRFYEEINQLVQEEPGEAIDPDFRGLLAAIGIEKGKSFEPDARMKRILTDAAAVANATARSILFANRDKEFFLYPNSYWEVGFLGGSHEFLLNGARYLDARTRMFYYATGITPAMAMKMVGIGSQYAISFRDSQGNYFDGGQNYKLLVNRGLRRTDALHAPDRPAVSEPRQPEERRRQKRRRLRGRLLRPEGAAGQGRQLDPDGTGQKLERHPATLRSARAVVRQDLAA